ncbi:epimerase [Devosia riboflavina]|uniref:Epimerase n=1 Tax=Devosia riboflavina TaxID=46914 RepID=A0A087LZY1_9HYPH|nr:aldehyde reductase [Devosia riboflavina]KFL30184.1 epimerase [Devosia riboflavina]
MSETVLVTGGNGYVGGWCIVELLRTGYRVRTTLRDLGKAEKLRGIIAASGEDTTKLEFAAVDLMRDAGWPEALAGCSFVLHVASPLGGGAKLDRDALVAPARDGTLRVLRFAKQAGIRRVVMTSAAAAARSPLASGRVSDETVWADPDDPQFDAYRRSKILAERAAWDFMRREGQGMELVTILPGAVFGPVLSADNLGSVDIIKGLVEGRPPAMPRLGFWVVDVRDLAQLHVRALSQPEAAGQRYIAAGEFLWMEEMAARLRYRLGARGTKISRRRLPTWLVRLLLPFMPNLRTLAPLLGKKFELSTAKARRELDFTPRPASDTLFDCAESLVAK